MRTQTRTPPRSGTAPGQKHYRRPPPDPNQPPLTEEELSLLHGVRKDVLSVLQITASGGPIYLRTPPEAADLTRLSKCFLASLDTFLARQEGEG